jgi:DNA repair protein RadC
MAEIIATPYRARLRTFTILKCAEPDPIATEPIISAKLAARYLLSFFRSADAGQEHFAALFLDTRRFPICAKVMFSGTTGEAAVYPKEIARAALLLNASAVIIAHNHPSGDLLPSAADQNLTRRIEVFLRSLDLELLDNLIFSVESGRFRSVKDGETGAG